MAGKAIFLPLCRFHICVDPSFLIIHRRLQTKLIHVTAAHAGNHQRTDDSGDRGRRLIGADLKRDLMMRINLDFRGQVGLADAVRLWEKASNWAHNYWLISYDQLAMQNIVF